MWNVLILAIAVLFAVITVVLGMMASTGKFMPFIAWTLLVFSIYQFILKAEDRETKELVDGVNSGKYGMIGSSDVRKLRGEYFKIDEDGKLTLIVSEDIVYIGEDGTIYVE